LGTLRGFPSQAIGDGFAGATSSREGLGTL
jgi:hypothetical protein